MPGFIKKLGFLLFFAAMATVRVWPHEGHDHAKEANLQVLKAGPNQQFQVSVAHLPDVPVAGQLVKFLALLEETSATDDPLLGGRLPVTPATLEISLREEGKPAAILKATPAGEPGVYQFQHQFSESGRWQLNLKFQNSAGVEGKAEVVIPVKGVPGGWTLPLLQGVILLGSIALVIQRFVVSPPRTAVVSALAIVVAGGGVLALVTQKWPSAVPPVAGELTVEALQPPAEPSAQVPIAETPRLSGSAYGSAYDAPLAEAATVTGTVRYAGNRMVALSNPSPGTIVYKQGAPKIGDAVKSGQVLAVVQNRFNSHDAAHLLNQRWDFVKAQLKAKDEHVQADMASQKAARLFELGSISGRQLQAAKFRLDAANSALKEANDRLKLHDAQIQETNLKEVEVTSPINGYVSKAVYPASGQVIYGGEMLFEIVDPSVVWVEATALPRDLQQVTEERTVIFRSSVIPDRSFRAKLLNVRSDTDPVAKTVRLLYEVQNPESWLKAGMLLSASFGGGSEKSQGRASQVAPPSAGKGSGGG
jgi:multidrug efflux pump subunit AcrA (membrane-fusion protein)